LSLIVAELREGKIVIVSDTHLTDYPAEMHPKRQNASPSDGAIKCIIIGPHLCVAVAGMIIEIEIDELFTKIRGLASDLRKVLDTLTKFHLANNMQTTFMAGVSLPPVSKMYVINNGHFTSTTYAWIGVENGFKAFESRRAEIEKTWPKNDFQYIIEQSLKKVIEDSVDPAINGFMISVANTNGIFEYRSAVDMYLLPRTLPPGFSVIGHGTAQEGAYSVHFFQANDSNTALGIHFLQGNFGIVYAIRNNGLLYPEIFSNVDEDEFAAIITPKFGVKKIASLPVPVESYLKRGNKAVEAGDYSKALDLYDKGLSISGHPLYATLQFNRGKVLNYLNRHQEAMQSFRQAVQKDSSFQSKILSFLTSPRKK
jgi:hypothetical protein